ncbi:MAG: putative DNA-binding domain-containing protein, partial [Planctomycetaceae bacterium]|nr:putative DNA-binding domain-containing protein [Planctomycetaceae bacterium]
MSTPELSTADLQKWLLTVSTHPSGLQAGIQQAQGSHNAVVDQVIDADFGISAAHRLAIYHHGYYARLLNCLQAEYPVLRNAFSPEW